MLLEVAVFNYSSAISATNAGADRLELCTNYHEGGITASFGILKLIRKKISIPIFPIIRPRGGNFVYDDEELEVMKKDIIVCKNIGFEGVVIGSLNHNNTVNFEQTKQLVNLAYPLEVTFHRAFDKVNNPFEALEQIINAGCTRILSSGLKSNAIDGAEVIKQLINQSNFRVSIMPGGGIRSNNIEAIVSLTKAEEFHTAAITDLSDANYLVNANEVIDMKKKLHKV